MATFSFGGCGWLLSYGLGFAKSSQLLLRDVPWFREAHFAGASGGGLVAAVLASGVPAETVQQYVWEAARRLEVLPFNSFRSRVGLELSEGMEKFFPDDVHHKVKDRLHVSLTRLEHFVIPRNRLISQFSSRQHLLDTLRTSCHIPGYSATSFKWLWHENAWHFDGGLTDNAPIVTPHTYRISPFTHPDTYDVSPYYPHPCYTFANASATLPTSSANQSLKTSASSQPLQSSQANQSLTQKPTANQSLTNDKPKYDKPTSRPPRFSPSATLSETAASAPLHPIMPSPSTTSSDKENVRPSVGESAVASDFEPFEFTTAQLIRYAAWPTARVLERVFQKGEEDGALFIKLLLSHSTCELCEAAVSKIPPDSTTNKPGLVPARLITPWIWSRLPVVK